MTTGRIPLLSRQKEIQGEQGRAGLGEKKASSLWPQDKGQSVEDGEGRGHMW